MNDLYYRVEIIANKTVEDVVIDRLKEKNVGRYYTMIPIVDGSGSSGSRMGDGVWPEENFLMVIYASGGESDAITAVIKEIKELYPIEGIKLYRSPAEVLI